MAVRPSWIRFCRGDLRSSVGVRDDSLLKLVMLARARDDCPAAMEDPAEPSETDIMCGLDDELERVGRRAVGADASETT